ncbi:MAG: HAD family hydrolase [Leptospiraceae bacterium]|nr:HAD family hydrolase [Leptospiraceae bacterium]
MTSRFQAVFFDVDGTIFSSESIIKQVYHDNFQAFRQRTGKPQQLPALEAIMAQIGKPVRTIFDNLVPELTFEEREELSNEILSGLVKRIGAGEGHYYPGITETVHDLAGAGLKIFAASNGRKPYVDAILKACQIFDDFTEVPVLDYQTIHTKVELVARTMENHGLSAEQCVLVGDRESDRQAAIQNNVAYVACAYGHGDAEEHKDAIRIISEPAELRFLIS